MLIQDLIKEFRDQVSDIEPPYLWSDDSALLWVIDAQDVFVRRMGGISDAGSITATQAVTDIALVANAPTSAYSPYILRIRSAKLITAQRNIHIVDESDLNDLRTCDYGITSPAFISDTDTGTVSYGIIGLEDYKLRWYKVPNTADTCRMHVYRLPYPRITSSEGTLEIDEQHHLHLIMWMKKWAYSKEDAETYDKDLALKNEQAFEAYCDRAKAEKERQRYKPRIVRSDW